MGKKNFYSYAGLQDMVLAPNEKCYNLTSACTPPILPTDRRMIVQLQMLIHVCMNVW